MKKTISILVTGIGGNVGQGILRNIQAYAKENEQFIFRIIGINVIPISAGNHLCDKTYEIEYAYDENYIPSIIAICETEKIDVVFPSTDYEVYYLSKNAHKLPKMAVSPTETNEVFLDKYKTWEFFAKHQIPFAHSYLPSTYPENAFQSYILKPKEGRGSRGIHINPKNIKDFSDDYMVQELWTGKEITCAFYVTRQQKLHGFITFERELQSGATAFCEVIQKYDSELEKIIKKMMLHLKIVGSCNIQAIVTEEGKIMPFEINGRISGTNSIRSQFGFKDIEYILEEYVFDKEPTVPKITKGSAIRILMDIIYPNSELKEPKNNQTDHFIY
ncbi:ATP-grasp domain-containing protein [Bernardetia sp. MNP-M8]|uniref:ATP-grasp domain-containing protein n=1 Tax=Bernardetia sp. MNP-M8 TaxID=3127470 RepID=UPI0030CDE966